MMVMMVMMAIVRTTSTTVQIGPEIIVTDRV